MKKCVICELRRAASSLVMCATCGRSYDRETEGTDVATMLEWCANRTRKYALRARLKAAGILR